MARHRKRTRYAFILFSSCTTLGWIPTKRISFPEGEENVSKGLWQRVANEHGAHIGYQPLLYAVPVASLDTSRCALGPAEMRANAGLLGRSRTACMAEEQRKTRVHPKSGRLLPEMDFIESVRVLVKCYPHSANFHDVQTRGMCDRALRVYPRA